MLVFCIFSSRVVKWMFHTSIFTLLLHKKWSETCTCQRYQGPAGEWKEEARTCRERERKDRAGERRAHGEAETDRRADDESSERYPFSFFILPSVFLFTTTSLFALVCHIREHSKSRPITSFHYDCITRINTDYSRSFTNQKAAAVSVLGQITEPRVAHWSVNVGWKVVRFREECLYEPDMFL